MGGLRWRYGILYKDLIIQLLANGHQVHRMNCILGNEFGMELMIYAYIKLSGGMTQLVETNMLWRIWSGITIPVPPFHLNMKPMVEFNGYFWLTYSLKMDGVQWSVF